METTKFNIPEITEFLSFCYDQGLDLSANGVWVFSDVHGIGKITNEELINKYIYHYQLKKP